MNARGVPSAVVIMDGQRARACRIADVERGGEPGMTRYRMHGSVNAPDLHECGMSVEAVTGSPVTCGNTSNSTRPEMTEAATPWGHGRAPARSTVTSSARTSNASGPGAVYREGYRDGYEDGNAAGYVAGYSDGAADAADGGG